MPGEAGIPWLHAIRLGGERLLVATVTTGRLLPAGSPERGRRCYNVVPTTVEVVDKRALVPGETFETEDHRLALDAVAASGDHTAAVWRWWTSDQQEGGP